MKFESVVKRYGFTIFIINIVLLAAEYFIRFVMESDLTMRMDAGFWFSSDDMASLAMQFGILDNLIQYTFYLVIITAFVALYSIDAKPQQVLE